MTPEERLRRYEEGKRARKEFVQAMTDLKQAMVEALRIPALLDWISALVERKKRPSTT